MADTVTRKRTSSTTKTLLIENDAKALSDGTYVVLVSKHQIETYDRATIHILSDDENGGLTAKVWGSLFEDADVPGSAKWVQIGDDIVVAASSGAMKSVSTTALKYIGVTVKATDGSSSTTISAGDCKLFLQGTI
tara:strand:+ start:20 stop:424 length:405 start_codon:yes stop_codon:yes gene_type:complete